VPRIGCLMLEALQTHCSPCWSFDDNFVVGGVVVLSVCVVGCVIGLFFDG